MQQERGEEIAGGELKALEDAEASRPFPAFIPAGICLPRLGCLGVELSLPQKSKIHRCGGSRL
jgi:hypothetical protein